MMTAQMAQASRASAAMATRAQTRPATLKLNRLWSGGEGGFSDGPGCDDYYLESSPPKHEDSSARRGGSGGVR